MDSTSNLPSERLPFRTKLIYGFGDWGNTTTTTIFAFFFAFFLTDIAHLPPLYAAPVLLVGGIWDAINDPLVGILTDRMRSRWGRRRPFFLFGAIPFALTFIMMWWVPPFESMAAKAIYYTIAYILWDTAFTMVCVPYSALTPELTEDYDERTRLTGYRMAVSMGGGMIAAIVVPLIVDAFVLKPDGYLLMAVIFGILAALPYLLLFFNTRERYSSTPPTELNIFRAFKQTMSNRPFRYAAGIYLTAWVTVALVTALFQYYVTYWLRQPDSLAMFLGLIQGSALIGVPIMVKLSDKLEKRKAYFIGMVWWIVVMLILAVMPSDAATFAIILAAVVGPGVAAAHVIPWSIVPDVIEADELATGERREGAYYGFLVFIQKTGAAFTLALMQLVLGATGYVADQPQNDGTLLAIRLMIGLVPAVLLSISIWFAWRYPINKAQHNEMRAALAAKRAKG
jgi:glycoside/pentoside/hexuronide:cation symporter, GPH family